jgi:hypothetical protein
MAWKKNNDYNQEPEDKISRINTAGLTNINLENLWKDCYNAMAHGQLVLWNRKLDAIWSILGGDQKEGDDFDKEMKSINLALYKTGSLNHTKKGFGSLSDKEAENMSLQYLYLNKKSLFLRRLQNKQGRGTAYANEDEDDFD